MVCRTVWAASLLKSPPHLNQNCMIGTGKEATFPQDKVHSEKAKQELYHPMTMINVCLLFSCPSEEVNSSVSADHVIVTKMSHENYKGILYILRPVGYKRKHRTCPVVNYEWQRFKLSDVNFLLSWGPKFLHLSFSTHAVIIRIVKQAKTRVLLITASVWLWYWAFSVSWL